MPELDPRDARIAELEGKIASLRERIARLEAENAELRARLNQNSRNSSKPPSSDPPGVARQPKEPTGRHRGGQPGHKVRKRERLPPNRVVPVPPSPLLAMPSRNCRAETPRPTSTRSWTFPRSAPTSRIFELHELGCECGARTRATLPDGVPQGAFGPRLTANGCPGAPAGTGCPSAACGSSLRDLFGVDVALGSVAKMEQFVSEAIAAPVEEARAAVQEQAVAHQDETGWYEGPDQGRKARAWLWVAVTALATVWAHMIRDFCCFADRGGSGGHIGQQLLGAHGSDVPVVAPDP